MNSDADVAVVGDEVLFFRTVGGVGSGGARLQAVRCDRWRRAHRSRPGRYANGDLAVVDDDRVVFSADDRVWVAAVRG